MNGMKAPVWFPGGKYTWTKKQIDLWVQSYGRKAFYNGELWEINAKKISVSKFYDVWFTVSN